jgi:hypothetical protein
MEPKHNNDYLPPVELPPMQEVPAQAVGPEQSPAGPEIRGTQSAHAAGSDGTNYGTPQGAVSGMPSDGVGISGQPQTSVTPVHTAGLIADDADLIEKEWVLKAKAIVAHTRKDPHLQNLEMTNIKADYLKKRYNKDLKTSGS